MKKLGTMVKDSATGLTGMLTQFERRIAGQEYYLMQPRGVDPETGQPLERLWVDEPRIEGGVDVLLPEVWPLEILGTEVEDEASGFKGMAIALSLHISGCIHVQVQPRGTKKNGSAIASENFDLRRLKGEALKPLSESDRQASQKERPSPGPLVSSR